MKIRSVFPVKLWKNALSHNTEGSFTKITDPDLEADNKFNHFFLVQRHLWQKLHEDLLSSFYTQLITHRHTETKTNRKTDQQPTPGKT